MANNMTKYSPTQVMQCLEANKKSIEMAMPKSLMTFERAVRMAVTCFSRNPTLHSCSPQSILACVVQGSELGLEFSGPLGHAYMVPYWNRNSGAMEAQFQIGYRGLIELAHRSGKVKTFASHIVYEKDEFEYQYGTDTFLRHKPAIRGDRGKPIAVYAVVKLFNGGEDFEVMSVSDIEKHRAKYSKAKGSSPWDTAWEEMAKKTPLRRLAKRVPLCVELISAAVMDEEVEVRNVADNNDTPPPPPATGRLDLSGPLKADSGGDAAKPEQPAAQDGEVIDAEYQEPGDLAPSEAEQADYANKLIEDLDREDVESVRAAAEREKAYLGPHYHRVVDAIAKRKPANGRKTRESADF